MRYLALIVVLVSLSSCKKDVQIREQIFKGNAFGTTYSIKIFSEEQLTIDKGLDSIFYAVNKSVSTYMPESDISKINRGDSTIVVDQIFKDVFVLSSEVNDESFGYFDPTVGVLRNAYGFGDVDHLKHIDTSTLDSLMQFVGFNKVVITSEGTIKKEHPQIYFDFNAVAKGYGIDQIGAYLDSIRIDNYLIELGGEILTKGKNVTKDSYWTAGVEDVDSDLNDRTTTAIVTLEDEALASSGNYRKFRIDAATGKKYVHTINPLTGSAEQSDVTSASVIAKTCAEADAYATACMALGIERAKMMLAKVEGIEAYLTYNDSLNESQVFVTPGFQDRIIK